MYVELTNPNHVLRPNDEFTCYNINDHETPVNEWRGCIRITDNHIGKTIRQVEEEYDGDGFWYRCRAEDAPGPQYVELPPKKTRVRLWLVGNLVVSSPDSPCDAAVELHLDSEGFFHEG